MDMHVFESLQLISLLLLNLYNVLFLRTGQALTFSFTAYVCTLIMRFSPVCDSSRATHSFFT